MSTPVIIGIVVIIVAIIILAFWLCLSEKNSDNASHLSGAEKR